MAGSYDPVQEGFITSLARPGGNITGLSFLAAELPGKRLELLKETVPQSTRIAVMWNPAWSRRMHPGSAAAQPDRGRSGAGAAPARRGGPPCGRVGHRLRGDDPGTCGRAPRDGGRAGAIHSARTGLADLAATSRLPAMYSWREYVEAGGLMAYGPSLQETYRRAATYVDKILKGAKPADLPVEQPTKFELVINLKTAKALGLTIPPTLLLLADEVIQ